MTEKPKITRRHLLRGGGVTLILAGVGLSAPTLIDKVRMEAKVGSSTATPNPAAYTPYADVVQSPTPVTSGSASGGAATAPAYESNPAFSQNFESDAYGEPINGSVTDIDLTGISGGGGVRSDTVDWGTLPSWTLRCETVGLNMPVVSKGKTLVSESTQADGTKVQTYQIDVPVSFQAAWLNTSAPINGDKGTVVVVGHVNYWSGAMAPMYSIKLMQPGNIVWLSADTPTVAKWSVVRTLEVNQTEFSQVTNSTDTTGARRLLLVTCQLDSNGNYTKNTVVELVPAT